MKRYSMGASVSKVEESTWKRVKSIFSRSGVPLCTEKPIVLLNNTYVRGTAVKVLATQQRYFTVSECEKRCQEPKLRHGGPQGVASVFSSKLQERCSILRIVRVRQQLAAALIGAGDCVRRSLIGRSSAHLRRRIRDSTSYTVSQRISIHNVRSREGRFYFVAWLITAAHMSGRIYGTYASLSAPTEDYGHPPAPFSPDTWWGQWQENHVLF